jgi:hypothetical protein
LVRPETSAAIATQSAMDSLPHFFVQVLATALFSFASSSGFQRPGNLVAPGFDCGSGASAVCAAIGVARRGFFVAGISLSCRSEGGDARDDGKCSAIYPVPLAPLLLAGIIRNGGGGDDARYQLAVRLPALRLNVVVPFKLDMF